MTPLIQRNPGFREPHETFGSGRNDRNRRGQENSDRSRSSYRSNWNQWSHLDNGRHWPRLRHDDFLIGYQRHLRRTHAIRLPGGTTRERYQQERGELAIQWHTLILRKPAEETR